MRLIYGAVVVANFLLLTGSPQAQDEIADRLVECGPIPLQYSSEAGSGQMDLILSRSPSGELAGRIENWSASRGNPANGPVSDLRLEGDMVKYTSASGLKVELRAPAGNECNLHGKWDVYSHGQWWTVVMQRR